jgi:hypothetical protein
MILANNATTRVSPGKYALRVSGALDLQWQLESEGFNTITDGSFSAASDVTVELPICEIKVINGGANTLDIKLISK